MSSENRFGDKINPVREILLKELSGDTGGLLDEVIKLLSGDDKGAISKFLDKNPMYDEVLTKPRPDELGEDRHQHNRSILSYIRFLLEEEAKKGSY